MQVNNSSTNLYNPYAKTPTQEQSSDLRQFAAGVVKKNSVEDQIEIYAKTTQNANEQYQDTNEAQSNQSANYNEFMGDVQQAENYQTYLNNGGDPQSLKEIIDRPSIQPLPENPIEEQSNISPEVAAGIAKKSSVESQIDAYKMGSDSSTSDYMQTQSYVQDYNDFAKDVRRAENINTYLTES